jgi:uroporphyrinogen-III decarboxylase
MAAVSPEVCFLISVESAVPLIAFVASPIALAALLIAF